MSQGQTTEPVALPAARASDGMFRPGRTQRETLLTVLRLAARYEQWVTPAGVGGQGRKFPPASISGAVATFCGRRCTAVGWVEKRRREWVTEEVVWEYRLGTRGS